VIGLLGLYTYESCLTVKIPFINEVTYNLRWHFKMGFFERMERAYVVNPADLPQLHNIFVRSKGDQNRLCEAAESVS